MSVLLSISPLSPPTMTSRKTQDSLPTSHPPPWTLKGEMYWLIAPKFKEPLPANIYAPLEERIIFGEANDFQGGLCYMQVVRYSDSPVGPYDELAMVPGVFRVPGGKFKGKKKMRVQRKTMFNGRSNWNIPKHLARFEFSAPLSRKGEAPPKELKVAVYPPDTPEGGRRETPFFKATLTPSRWLPGIPMTTKYVPFLDVSLCQPPILQGDDPFCAGAETWKVLPFELAAKYRLMWVDVDHGATKTEDEHWPQNIKHWSFGFWMQDGRFTFDAPVDVFKL